MIRLVHEVIDPTTILSQVSSPNAGAVVLFLGTTREFTHGKQTASLDYDCYADMAAKKLAELEAEARRRWPLEACVVVHRLGHLKIEEASVAVATSSAHRADAFEAARWLIDTIKTEVPIWKKENWADGSTEWVHPGLEQGESA